MDGVRPPDHRAELQTVCTVTTVCAALLRYSCILELTTLL